MIKIILNERAEMNYESKKAFEANIEKIVLAYLNKQTPKIKMVGNKRTIEKFANTIKKEVAYIKICTDYPSDSTMAIKAKEELKSAISDFTRNTGLNWPIR